MGGHLDGIGTCGNTLEHAWFCIRTHPKHEHIAAANLRRMCGMDTYNPQFSFHRPTGHGVASVTEPVFPCYIFGCFHEHLDLDQVRYTPAVKNIVHFGNLIPTVPHETIESLHRALETTDAAEIPGGPQAGDRIAIASGPFEGLEGVVLRVVPARQRVQVLLELLGRSAVVEVTMGSLALERQHPALSVLGVHSSATPTQHPPTPA